MNINASRNHVRYEITQGDDLAQTKGPVKQLKLTTLFLGRFAERALELLDHWVELEVNV